MPANFATGCVSNDLEPVYHGETGVRMLQELARSYLTIVKDLSRVMNRLKALYRSWAIPCAGRDVYYARHRSEWLGKTPEAGTRRRAEQLYQQLDILQHLRQTVRRELLAESRKHAITAKLRQIPSLGPIRSSLAVALIQTPHRFRTKRQLWTYSGLGFGNPRRWGISLRPRPTAAPQKAWVLELFRFRASVRILP
jgi:transposase